MPLNTTNNNNSSNINSANNNNNTTNNNNNSHSSSSSQQAQVKNNLATRLRHSASVVNNNNNNTNNLKSNLKKSGATVYYNNNIKPVKPNAQQRTLNNQKTTLINNLSKTTNNLNSSNNSNSLNTNSAIGTSSTITTATTSAANNRLINNLRKTSYLVNIGSSTTTTNNNNSNNNKKAKSTSNSIKFFNQTSHMTMSMPSGVIQSSTSSSSSSSSSASASSSSSNANVILNNSINNNFTNLNNSTNLTNNNINHNNHNNHNNNNSNINYLNSSHNHINYHNNYHSHSIFSGHSTMMPSVASRLKKNIARTKEKILQGMGKTDRTSDENFDLYVENFERQHTQASKLNKELNKYLNCLKETQKSSRIFYDTLRETYESGWPGSNLFGEQVQIMEVKWNDYLNRLINEVQSPLVAYLNEFPELKKKIEKRSNRLLDFDDARHTLEGVQNKSSKKHSLSSSSGGSTGGVGVGSNGGAGSSSTSSSGTTSTDHLTKITKLKIDLEDKQHIYEEINQTLCMALPVLFENRIKFYSSLFQSFFHTETIFHSDCVEIKTKLDDICEVLSTKTAQTNVNPQKQFQQRQEQLRQLQPSQPQQPPPPPPLTQPQPLSQYQQQPQQPPPPQQSQFPKKPERANLTEISSSHNHLNGSGDTNNIRRPPPVSGLNNLNNSISNDQPSTLAESASIANGNKNDLGGVNGLGGVIKKLVVSTAAEESESDENENEKQINNEATTNKPNNGLLAKSNGKNSASNSKHHHHHHQQTQSQQQSQICSITKTEFVPDIDEMDDYEQNYHTARVDYINKNESLISELNHQSKSKSTDLESSASIQVTIDNQSNVINKNKNSLSKPTTPAAPTSTTTTTSTTMPTSISSVSQTSRTITKCLYKVKATYPYDAKELDELTFIKDDLIEVVEGTESEKEELDEGWLIGVHELTKKRGLFPENFTKKL